MGITIHYRFSYGQRKEALVRVLDWVEDVARIDLKLPERKGEEDWPEGERFFWRPSETKLWIQLPGCETLCFDFRPYAQWVKEAKGEWQYEASTLKKYEGEIEARDYVCSAFCKTQYAKNPKSHMVIAELIRLMSSCAELAIVSDEGDYYHSRNSGDVDFAIKENAKVIKSILGKLKKAGIKDHQIEVAPTMRS